ncbi:MAG: hypothetical protein K2J79_01835 [Ruminiclostridium sp.]|nr:hypothetical protein [Ruminiclostridium sp.]
MKYFINEELRKESHSTCYFEFQRGKYKNKCWKEDSLNLPQGIFVQLNLGKIISEIIPEFDYYGITKVNLEQWEKLKELLAEKGGEYEDLLTELEPWVNENFKNFKVFTICGM